MIQQLTVKSGFIVRSDLDIFTILVQNNLILSWWPILKEHLHRGLDHWRLLDIKRQGCLELLYIFMS